MLIIVIEKSSVFSWLALYYFLQVFIFFNSSLVVLGHLDFIFHFIKANVLQVFGVLKSTWLGLSWVIAYYDLQ